MSKFLQGAITVLFTFLVMTSLIAAIGNGYEYIFTDGPQDAKKYRAAFHLLMSANLAFAWLCITGKIKVAIVSQPSDH